MADEEKQDLTESKAKKGLSMPILIAIITSGVILLVVAIIFTVTIMMNNMKESILNSSGKKITKTETKKEPKEESLDKFKYLETGRITTNPASSTQFVVLNLGIFYGPDKSKKHGEEEEEEPEGGGGEHGGKAAGPSPKLLRLHALIKHQINSQIGMMDVMTLQGPRDSLMTTFKNRLAPAFKLEGYYLKDVILLEFIIQ